MSGVHFEAERPTSYDRRQILIRLLVMLMLAVLGAPLGWLFWMLYFGLPTAAAVFISSGGGQRYQDEVGPDLVDALRWLLAVHAFIGLLTDRFPTSRGALGIRFEVDRSGTPTLRSSLLRLLTSIPAALMMWLLGMVAVPVWLIGAVSILAAGTCPGFVLDFQRAFLGVFARFLAHHASLVAGPAPLRLGDRVERVPAVT